MKAVDYLATKLGSPWIKRSDFKAYIAIKTLEVGPNDLSSLGNGVSVEGEVKKPNHSINMVLLKSTRPMNLNGKSVLKAGLGCVTFILRQPVVLNMLCHYYYLL